MYWTAEVSVLRGKIARLVEANQRLLGFIDPEGIADAILEMPEIAEALEYTAHVIANLMPNETTLEFTVPDPIVRAEVKGDQFYIIGGSTVQTMQLVPRKWWQLWKPRYVEEWRSWDINDTSPTTTQHEPPVR